MDEASSTHPDLSTAGVRVEWIDPAEQPITHPLLSAIDPMLDGLAMLRFHCRQLDARRRCGLPADQYDLGCRVELRRIKPHLQTLLAACERED